MQTNSYQGLSTDEYNIRLKTFGLNLIVEDKTNSLLAKILRQLLNPLVVILLIVSLISLFLGDILSSLVILLMVFLSLTLDFWQEFKSDKAAQKLAEKLIRKATVIRNSQKIEVPIDTLVPGDLLFLSIGDIIPADSIILESDNFVVNESVLTGEAYPENKNPVKLNSETILAYSNYSLDQLETIDIQKENKAFAGTNVVGGWAYLLVIATGKQSEVGKIQKTLSFRRPETEFEKELKSFGILIVKISVVLVSIILAIILLKQILLERNFALSTLLTALLFSVSIIVGLTPEMLPVILSLNMVRGALLMSQKGALVKRLNSIPDFGSMDVLCTDKTGTLTEDRIDLIKYIDFGGKESEIVLDLGSINSHFQSGLKNPLDKAILVVNSGVVANYEKVGEIPYNFERKRVSVAVSNETTKEIVLVTKGQPEEIFKICKSYVSGAELKNIQNLNKLETSNLRESDFERMIKIYQDLSNQGFRVLAVSYKLLKGEDLVKLENEKIEQNSVLIGFLAFLDPAKHSVSKTIKELLKAGVNLKIITGDNEFVTQKICKDINLNITDVITGDKFDLVSEKEKSILVEKCNVFARFNPHQKEEVIKLLKLNNHVVGYMGDGVNDSPSLKTSDVGISVDNAVDIARESADIVLLKKDLNILLDGILEGRKTFANTRKYIMMTLSSNFGNMFSMMGAALFLPFLPMLPIQILLNNILYDTSQASLPLDSVDKQYLEKPRRWNLKFIEKFMLFFGPISSIFDFTTFFVLFSVLKLDEKSFQTAWFIESLATQLLVVFIIRTRLIPFIQSRPSKWLVLTILSLLVLGVMFTFIPITVLLFGFNTLSGKALLIISLIVVLYLLMVQVLKQWFFKKFSTD